MMDVINRYDSIYNLLDLAQKRIKVLEFDTPTERVCITLDTHHFTMRLTEHGDNLPFLTFTPLDVFFDFLYQEHSQEAEGWREIAINHEVRNRQEDAESAWNFCKQHLEISDICKLLKKRYQQHENN